MIIMAKKRLDENMRMLILSKTQELLQSKSFSDISLNNIAKYSGISKGTLYYYYKSKDDIIVEIYGQSIDSLWDEFIEWVTNKDKNTSLHRVAKFVIMKGTGSSSIRLNLISDAANGNNELKKRLLEKYNAFVDAFYNKLREDMTEEDARFVSWLLVIVTDGVNVQKSLHNPKFDSESFIRMAEDFFLKAEESL